MNPTKAEVTENVILILKVFSGGLSPDFIRTNINSVLKNPPLNFDDATLGNVTGSLRYYVKSLNPSETIVNSEVRKSNLTVKNLIDLICTKVNAI